MMREKARLSIIIPIYNCQTYLRQCLDTVVNQNIEKIQIICINDGSTDSSEQILHDFVSRDDRIKVITQKNSGAGKARNKGIEAANGEFVAFLDADDYYPSPDSLRMLYEAAKTHNALACAGSFCENRKGRLRKKYPAIFRDYVFTEEQMVRYEDFQFDYGFHRFIYNLDILRKNEIRFPDYSRFEDPPFFVQAMITIKKFYAIKEFIYCYRFGYKKATWDKKNTGDLIRGLTDNLKMSRALSLARLHAITLRRLNIDFVNAILENISDPSIRHLLEVADRFIDKRLLARQGINIKNLSTILPLKGPHGTRVENKTLSSLDKMRMKSFSTNGNLNMKKNALQSFICRKIKLLVRMVKVLGISSFVKVMKHRILYL